jgi:hypothetical protein
MSGRKLENIGHGWNFDRLRNRGIRRTSIVVVVTEFTPTPFRKIIYGYGSIGGTR